MCIRDRSYVVVLIIVILSFIQFKIGGDKREQDVYKRQVWYSWQKALSAPV